jgi:hypothetical protein
VERGHGHLGGADWMSSSAAPGRRGWRGEHHCETGYPLGKVVWTGAHRSDGSMARRVVATVGGSVPRRRGSSGDLRRPRAGPTARCGGGGGEACWT